MTPETLEKANEITEEIESLKNARTVVSNESFYRALPLDVMVAGKAAMLAAIDEAIDAAQRELDGL